MKIAPNSNIFRLSAVGLAAVLCVGAYRWMSSTAPNSDAPIASNTLAKTSAYSNIHPATTAAGVPTILRVSDSSLPGKIAPAAAAKLFELDREQSGAQTAADMPRYMKRVRSLNINPSSLNEATLTLDLFGEQVTATRAQIQRDKPGQQVWVGHIDGNPLDTVIVTQIGQQISAMIQHGASIYSIGQGMDGKKQLREHNPQALPPEHPEANILPKTNRPVQRDGASAGSAVSGSAMVGGATARASVASDGANVQQDLLVVYTDQACARVGSCTQMQADIVTAVTEMNEIYRASGVPLTMNLVGMAKTTYAGPAIEGTVNMLAAKDDGVMDEVHALRDKLGADLVSLVMAGNDYCGQAFMGGGESEAFSVVEQGCVVGNKSMAHEVGHNQGADHDHVTSPGGTPGSYNYGFRRCDGGDVDNRGAPYFRTVMAYPCGSTPRVGLFSNPNVNYLGVPAGIDPAVDPAGGAWNAKTLTESAASMAGFRASQVAVAPLPAPSNLTAAAVSATAINLRWSDNATTESSYIVERSTANTPWSTIATLAASQVSFADSGLLAGTTYFYRVAARNDATTSAYSNTASIAPAPAPAPADRKSVV